MRAGGRRRRTTCTRDGRDPARTRHACSSYRLPLFSLLLCTTLSLLSYFPPHTFSACATVSLVLTSRVRVWCRAVCVCVLVRVRVVCDDRSYVPSSSSSITPMGSLTWTSPPHRLPHPDDYSALTAPSVPTTLSTSTPSHSTNSPPAPPPVLPSGHSALSSATSTSSSSPCRSSPRRV